MSGNTVDSAALVGALKAWNNFKLEQECWELYVGNFDEPVGYVKEDIKRAIDWDFSFNKQFQLDDSKKTIKVKDPATANKAFEDLYVANQGKSFVNGDTFNKWINSKKTNYHPIFTTDPRLDHLQVPSPLRGVLGILTAGIHVNVYSTKDNKIDKIWVSERSQGKTYAGCYDQIIAGGMEPEHCRDPWMTFEEECHEETKYRFENKKLWRVVDGDKEPREIGKPEEASQIYFFTDKNDDRVGESEKGHIEPGVRFCFDVKIAEGEEPRHNPDDKSSEGFKPFTVDEIKESLKKQKWKANCGLVMLDFLRRQELLSADEAKAVKEALDSKPELPIPERFLEFST